MSKPSDTDDDDAVPVAIPDINDPDLPTPASEPSRSRRVTPSETRPKLTPELEEKLAPIDARSAEGYDRMEDAGSKFSRFAEDDGTGVVRGDLEFTDSLVIEIKKAGA